MLGGDGPGVAVLHPVVAVVGGESSVVAAGGGGGGAAGGGGGGPREPAGRWGVRGEVGPVGGKHVERAAGLDRAELGPIPDEQDLGVDGAGGFHDGVEGEGAGQGGFVDDDQLPGQHRPPLPFVLDDIELGVEATGE